MGVPHRQPQPLNPTAPVLVYCDHCDQPATFEVTSLSAAEPTEPVPYVEHSIAVCTGHVLAAKVSARIWHGDHNPTITEFPQDIPQEAAA